MYIYIIIYNIVAENIFTKKKKEKTREIRVICTLIKLAEKSIFIKLEIHILAYS